jgi:endonuclease YncB( thermonuclease family)
MIFVNNQERFRTVNGMRDSCARCLLIALACLVGATSQASDRHWIQGTVDVRATHIWQVDGSLLRLNGVDAPVRNQKCFDAADELYNCAVKMRNQAEERWQGEPVSCSVIGANGRHDEPPAATCYTGSQNINAAMVASGLGIADRSETMRYVRYERHARTNELNLWSGRFMAPRIWRGGTSQNNHPY